MLKYGEILSHKKHNGGKIFCTVTSELQQGLSRQGER